MVSALEQLAEQEAACARTRDFAAVIEVQRRAAPIVERLAAEGPTVADATVRQRLAAVIERRDRTATDIQVQLEKTRQHLDALGARQRRVAQVAPVYGHVSAPRSQLMARG